MPGPGMAKGPVHASRKPIGLGGWPSWGRRENSPEEERMESRK